MCCRHCHVGILFAKIIQLFQISKGMDKIFLSEPKILIFATFFFTLLPLLMLNGSHLIGVRGQVPDSLIADEHAKLLTVLTDYSRRSSTSGYRCVTTLGCKQAMSGERGVCTSNPLQAQAARWGIRFGRNQGSRCSLGVRHCPPSCGSCPSGCWGCGPSLTYRLWFSLPCPS